VSFGSKHKSEIQIFLFLPYFNLKFHFSYSYPNAEKSMRRALERVKHISNRNSFKEWEPLFNNLGHVCRKQKYLILKKLG
jgi:hypothetical protein